MRRAVPPPGYVFLADTARQLGRDESLLRRMVRNGDIPAYRMGGLWVIAEPVVELLTHLDRPPGRPHGAPAAAAARTAWRRELFREVERLVPRPPAAADMARKPRAQCATPGCQRFAVAGKWCRAHARGMPAR